MQDQSYRSVKIENSRRVVNRAAYQHFILFTAGLTDGRHWETNWHMPRSRLAHVWLIQYWLKIFLYPQMVVSKIYLFSIKLLPTRAGSPQQHMPMTVGPFT